MSVYAEIAQALLADGSFPMPDGKRYPVRDITVGDSLRIAAIAKSGASDADSVPVFLAIAAKVTGAPVAVCEELTKPELTNLIAVAEFGAKAVGEAIMAEASASGNGAAPATAPTPARSISRKKR